MLAPMPAATANILRTISACACLAGTLLIAVPGDAADPSTKGAVGFDRPDGPYTKDDFKRDFGSFSADNAFTRIVGRSLEVTFPQGSKIEGLRGARVKIKPVRVVNLAYRVRYPKDFEPRLHGKQFGLAGGRGYTGGSGRECARNGDGWSVRVQFDAHDRDVTNQLYVYHRRMTGEYGDALGTTRQRITLERDTWHVIRLRVSMQSRADARDGAIEVWKDGASRIKVEGMQFVSREAGRQVDELVLEAFCGGDGITPTRDNRVFFDDIRWWAE